MNHEEMKRAIYEKLSVRRKKFIDRIGYDKWDPFQEPNHPIDIRKDITKRTSKQLVRDFLRSHAGDSYSQAYARGVQEFCMGLFQADERYQGMFDFCLWYVDELRRQGVDPRAAWER
jgi:hypothetical protein